MTERGPLTPWSDPPPGPKPSRTTRAWTALQTLHRAGWLRPRRVGCLLVVLLLLVFAALWAVKTAVDETVAMFGPAPITDTRTTPATPTTPPTSGSATIDRINRHHKIIVAVKQMPDFAEGAAKDWSGFDIGLVRLIAKRLGVDAEFLPFQDTGALDRGEIDMIVGGYQITPRHPAFAGPYLVSSLRMAVPVDSAVANPDSLGNGKICVPMNSSATLSEVVGDRLTTAGSLASCAGRIGNRINALAGKPVKAIAADDATLRALPEIRDGKFKEVGEPLASIEYGFALPSGDPMFRQRVNSVLREAIEDNTWAMLYEQHFGTPAPAPPVLPR